MDKSGKEEMESEEEDTAAQTQTGRGDRKKRELQVKDTRLESKAKNGRKQR